MGMPHRTDVTLGQEYERVWPAPGGPVTVVGDLAIYAAQPQVVTDAETKPSDYPVTIVALDRKSGAERWQRRMAAWVRGELAVVGDLVVVATGDGMLQGLALRDGQVRWQIRSDMPVASGTLGYVATDEVVSQRGEIAVLDLQTGRRTQTWPLAVPARIFLVAQGRWVFVGSADSEKSTVLALDARDGRELWRYSLGALPFAPVLSPAGDIVYIVYTVSNQQEVFALDVATGALRSQRTFSTRGDRPFTIDRGILFYDDGAGALGALDLTSGREQAIRTTGHTVRGFSVQNDHLLVQREGGVEARRLGTLDVVWNVTPAQLAPEIPTWIDEALYFPHGTVSLWVRNLALRIRSDSAVVHANGVISVDATFASTQGPLAIATWALEYFLLGGLTWTDATGKSYRFHLPTLQTAAPRQRSDFQLLGAGSTWSTKLSIPVGPEPSVDGRYYERDDGKAFTALPPGEYRLTLSYTNEDASYWTMGPGGWAGQSLDELWLGKLLSNVLFVRVEP